MHRDRGAKCLEREGQGRAEKRMLRAIPSPEAAAIAGGTGSPVVLSGE